MAKLLTCLLAISCYITATAQNLVGNTGFEERNVCVEYGVKCAPEAWFFLPRYAKMSPVEADSNHYELLLMGNPRQPYSVGNFIYTKLFCPLVAGAEYRISFRVHTGGYAFDYLDLWLGATEPWRGRYSFSTVRASVTILPDSVAGTDFRNWRWVHYTFKANGGERFLLIGNISQKPLELGRKKAKKNAIIEYGVDDISLYAVDPLTPKCPEYEAIRDQVYRNDARHPGRFVDDIPIDSSLIPGYGKPVPPLKDTVKLVPPHTDTLIIPDVLFKFDKSDLNPAFISRLDSFVTAIKAHKYQKLRVTGHTDDVGTDAYNLRLSQDRAVTIKTYLVSHLNISEELVEAVGYGESQPRATNSTAAGRQQNRRVEIILFYQ